MGTVSFVVDLVDHVDGQVPPAASAAVYGPTSVLGGTSRLFLKPSTAPG